MIHSRSNVYTVCCGEACKMLLSRVDLNCFPSLCLLLSLVVIYHKQTRPTFCVQLTVAEQSHHLYVVAVGACLAH